MRDKSDMDTLGFLLYSVFWAVISMIWYQGILFRCLPVLTYVQSKGLLWGMIVSGIVIGAFLTCRYRKNDWSITVSLALPYGVYTCLAYLDIVSKRIILIGIVALVLGAGYMIMVMCRRFPAKQNIWRVFRSRCYNCIYGSQSIFAAGMLVLMISIGLPSIFGSSLFKSSVTPTRMGQEPIKTIANSMSTILLLQEEEWKELNLEEKLDVMQIIANIEVNYLGIPYELNVMAHNLGETTLGSYVENMRCIYIDLTHLENDPAKEVLNTITHEIYHAYTYCLVAAYNSLDEDYKNLLLYEKTVSYVEEYNGYIEGEEDLMAYYMQECEADARQYAEFAVDDYYYRITEYLNNETEE